MEEHTATPNSIQRISEKSVYRSNGQERNVGDVERWASIIGGSVLALYGLRGSLGKLALAAGGGMLLYRGISGHCPAYEALGIHSVSQEGQRGVHFTEALTINKPVEEVYRFWRDLKNLPRFMTHLTSVTPSGGQRSHWVAKLPMYAAIEWDAEITEERNNELLAWRSLPGADVANEGRVTFRQAPGERGTEVQVTLQYYPGGGAIGTAVAQLFNSITAQQIKEDLRHVKHILEAGEKPTIAGQPSGSKR